MHTCTRRFSSASSALRLLMRGLLLLLGIWPSRCCNSSSCVPLASTLMSQLLMVRQRCGPWTFKLAVHRPGFTEAWPRLAGAE